MGGKWMLLVGVVLTAALAVGCAEESSNESLSEQAKGAMDEVADKAAEEGKDLKEAAKDKIDETAEKAKEAID